MASSLNTENNSSAHDVCMKSNPVISVEFDAQAYVGETANAKPENCKNTCCSDGDCLCKDACLHVAATHNLPLFSNQNVIFSLIGDSSGLTRNIIIHPYSNYYPPALRPPIC